MNNYEVRVRQTHIDYYRIEARSEDEAKALIRQRVVEDDALASVLINAKKVETIKRTPEVDYALELDAKGEVIL